MLGERGLGIFKANLLVFQIFYTGIFRATSFGDGGGGLVTGSIEWIYILC